MRILLVHKEGGIFGAEQFHLKTINHLIDRGLEIEFLRLYTDHQGGKDSEFVSVLQSRFGIKVHQANIGGIPVLTGLMGVYKIIKAGNYDLVHSHLIHADFFTALVKKLLLPKQKLVNTIHGYEEAYTNVNGFRPDKMRKNLYYRVNRFAQKTCNASFAISDGLRKLFVETGMSSQKKMQLIHYGFKMPEPSLDDGGVQPEGSPQLVIAGRLVSYKGHRFALQALAKMKKKYPKIKLWVLGIGELEEELKEMAVDLDIEENVDFLGYKTNVSDYMNAAQLVLTPSVSEGFGIVVLEAINTLRPIVSFDVPAMNEIVSEEYKYLLVEPYDVDHMVDRMNYILENKEVVAPLLDINKQRLNNYFTIDRMISEIVDFYKKVDSAN